ncbi:uncharacterized protein PAC_15910 [Phialocephala subalpina]|uniref:Nephrocystin 3-like N-terminal domain-containing protein n=1 Tax=Phialocephala subalpina TaxID=576137 RepID=A0A1L7XLS3_9HELO|nr:uncharacterized protein PAC_15910 [Phialocephala subalpina]
MPRAKYSEDVPTLDGENISDSDTDSLFDDEADSGTDTDLDSVLAEEDSDDDNDVFDDERLRQKRYSPKTQAQLDLAKEHYDQYCTFQTWDPAKCYDEISPQFIHGFLSWVVKIVAVEKDLDFTKRPSATIYAEDLAEYARVLLATTEMTFEIGWLRVQLVLFCELAGITGNRPEALVELRFRYLKLTLIRDPDRGGPRLFVELTPENEFKIPEIIYDPTLVLSPHIFLLGILFKARAFKSPSIDCPERLYSLKVLKGLNEQPLPLRDEMNNEFIFYQAVREAQGVRVARELQLSSGWVQYRMKVGGEIAGFGQVIRPYNLRDSSAKGLNESPDISDSLQNKILQYTSIGTFLKHYLNDINVDLQAAAETAPQRYCETVQDDQPVKDSERQLAGIVVDKDTRDALIRADMSPEQLGLIDAILTLPGKSPEQELQRRITAINAVTLYCGVEEGAPSRHVRHARLSVPRGSRCARCRSPPGDIFYQDQQEAQSMFLLYWKSAPNNAREGRWILENYDFQRWCNDQQSRLLWVKGDPGKGKTMLLCGIINELEKSMSKTAVL